MLRLVVMLPCAYCEKEIDRRVFCCTNHRTYYFKGIRPPQTRTPKIDLKSRLAKETGIDEAFFKAPLLCPKHRRFRAMADTEYPCGCQVVVK